MGKAIRKSGWCVLALLLAPGAIWSQESADRLSTNRMFWSGYAHTWYEASSENAGQNSYRVAAFPIFHYKVGKKIHFTSELELEMDGNSAEVGIETAEASVFLSNNFTLTAGRFFTPVGVFIERLHPAWINKLHSQPLYASHGNSMIPFTQVGVKLKGAFPFGKYRKVVLDIYSSNGVSFSTTTAASDHGGERVLCGRSLHRTPGPGARGAVDGPSPDRAAAGRHLRREVTSRRG